MNKINRIILCIIDDIRSDQFFELIDKNLLPNCKSLMEKGIFSKNCVTDFPSITYPTQVSIITGCYTGDYCKEPCHGIPLTNWMQRNHSPPILRNYIAKNMQIYKLNEDIGKNCKTILEMCDHGNTSSIAQFLNRGANYFFPERKTKLAMYYLVLKHSRNVKRMMCRANSTIVKKLLDTFENPKKFFNDKEPPIVSLLCFLSSDLIMHMLGSDSYLYKLNLLHIDKVIGLLVKELDRMGFLNETVLAITSDHGNYKANKVGDLTTFFDKYKLSYYHPRKNPKGKIGCTEYGGIGFFYFNGNNNLVNYKSWKPPTIKQLKGYGPLNIDLLETLFKISGTNLMYYRDDNNTFNQGKIFIRKRIKNTSKSISGIIEYKGIGRDYQTKYIPENGEIDVFNYLIDEKASKMMDNRFHTSQEWMSSTFHLDNPMYVDLIPRHFKNPRSADIILSNDGTIVYNIEHGRKKNRTVNCHDLGLKESSIVPLIIGGSPEIPYREIECCRIVDIVPTLMKCIKKNIHQSVIGESLI
jgi:hypothetical protein